MPGAGADPSRTEPELAPGPWLSGAGAAKKSGGSATLNSIIFDGRRYLVIFGKSGFGFALYEASFLLLDTIRKRILITSYAHPHYWIEL